MNTIALLLLGDGPQSAVLTGLCMCVASADLAASAVPQRRWYVPLAVLIFIIHIGLCLADQRLVPTAKALFFINISSDSQTQESLCSLRFGAKVRLPAA